MFSAMDATLAVPMGTAFFFAKFSIPSNGSFLTNMKIIFNLLLNILPSGHIVYARTPAQTELVRSPAGMCKALGDLPLFWQKTGFSNGQCTKPFFPAVKAPSGY